MEQMVYGLIETLESRQFLSSVILGGEGLLSVRPEVGAANTITVQYSEDSLSVDVSVASVNSHGVKRQISKSFPRTANIKKVLVVGSTRSNVITVGTTGTFLIPTEIQDHGGSDMITVGDQDATINGGHGNATISAGDGNNVIRGASGKNQITAGNGNNSILGGHGGDTIIVGDGANTIVGGTGADAIHAGNGDDTIFGEGTKNVIVAGDGNDTIWAGKGNDQVTAGNGNDALGALGNHNTLIGGTGHNTFLVHSVNHQTTNFDPAKDTLVIVDREPKPPKI